MVCDGPDPPDNSPHELTPPPRQDLILNGNNIDDSDDEQNDYFGYEPLPQVPVLSDHESSDDDVENVQNPDVDLPAIEPMENVLTRQVWTGARPTDPIQMDSEKAEQVMQAMANFTLPPTSIPEWAKTITEDQWKENLSDRIEKLKGNR